MGIKLFQMHAKCVFLNGFFQEEVYVEQPHTFENLNLPNHVFNLQKALYGLKQALQAWYEQLSKFLLENGFKHGQIDKCFSLKKKTTRMISLLYKFM